MDSQSKKNIGISVAFISILIIGFLLVFVLPSFITRYKLINVINKTIENEKISAYSDIYLSINDDEYELNFELNSTKINNKSIINLSSDEITLYYYDHKLINDNFRAFKIDFVDTDLSKISITKLISLMEVKDNKEYYDITLDSKFISSYLDTGIDLKDVKLKLYYDDKIDKMEFDIKGCYDDSDFSLLLKLDIYESDYTLPYKLENLIVDDKFEIIGTLDNHTLSLFKGAFELMHEENICFDVHVISNTNLIDIEGSSKYYRLEDEISVFENSFITIYSHDGKALNSNNEPINYNIKGYKSDTLFKMLYGIITNGSYYYSDNVYTFEIDENGINDLLNIFVSDYKGFEIKNGKMLLYQSDKIDKVCFKISGNILKIIDINIDIDVDVQRHIDYSIPLEIKNSLLNKE